MPPVVPSPQRSFFDPEFICPECVVEGTLPWLLARHPGLWCPLWLVRTWERRGAPGRDPWPVRVLLAFLILEHSEPGLSRRAAVRRARTDASWRAAMGLRFDQPTPGRRVLGRFEKFLAGRDEEVGVAGYLRLFEDLGHVCVDGGVLGERRVWGTDSTPMHCYGAVRDTVRQLGDGVVSLAREWARVTGTTLVALAEAWELPLLLAKSTKGHFSIDWSSPTERGQVVDEVARAALDVVDRIRKQVEEVRANKRKGLLRRCRNLMRVVAQDLEADEDGRLTVATRVAANRVISQTDPEARHGRKTQSVTFNGFKLHVVGEVVSGFIASLCVTAGNLHDSVPAVRLIVRAKALVGDLERVLGDTAYGGARLRHVAQGMANVEIVAPPPPATRGKTIGKQAFEVDLEARQVTCPQGRTVEQSGWRWSKEHGTQIAAFTWPTSVCASCPIREACCGKSGGGRRLALHPYEAELRAARAAWERPEVRADYRVRTQCERLVNQLTRHGARRARRWGLGAAQLQVHLTALGRNLTLLARVLT